MTACTKAIMLYLNRKEWGNDKTIQNKPRR